MALVTLATLLPPVTADQAKALLLETLQGIGPMQQVGNGAGTVVASGAPVNSYDVIIVITTGGSPGTAAFKYSLDDGNTYSGPFTVPSNGTYVISGSGVRLQFAGVFAVGDQYLFQTVFPPFPVNDWESGGAARTLVEADATTLADLSGNAIPGIAGGGLVQYATGGWLTLLSDQLYENERFNPGATSGLVSLTLSASASPLTINPGDIIVANTAGGGVNAYQFSNTTGTTISPGTTVSLPFSAIQPGAAYNVQNGTLTILLTPKPGLTANNPAPGTSSVSHSGGGAGTVAVSGSPNGNYSVVVKVVTTGGLGAGVLQISLDGGNNYASPFTIPGGGSYPIPLLNGLGSTGLTLTLANSFTATDTYSFTSYASWILTPGLDQESDPALQARDENKWSAIGVGGGSDATFDYLCRTAPNGGSEVSQTQIGADGTVAGQVDIVLAGINGPISATALANITTYVQQRLGVCELLSIQNAVTDTLSITAQVFCPAQSLAAVQGAVSAAFTALQRATPIGGVVHWSDIEAALNQKQAGVTEVFLTVPAPNTDTQLPSGNVVAFNLAGVSYIVT